jgi:predicted secreted protein
MATSGVINGTLMAIYINGSKVCSLLSNGFTITGATREVANKDSGNWASKASGRNSWSAQGSAHFEFAPTYGFPSLFTAISNGTLLGVVTKTGVSGDKYYSGMAYLTDLSPDFPDNDNSSYSFTLDGTGALTQSTAT